MNIINKNLNGKIYKIINNINDDIYIGSTMQESLASRFYSHRGYAKENYKTGKLHKSMRELGLEHFKIVLLEDVICENTEELRLKEDFYINKFKPTLNTRNATWSKEKRMKRYREKSCCEICNENIITNNISRHYKSKKHKRNSLLK